MSCENIPSISDLEKVKLNADDFGRLMGTGEGTSTNGVTGQVRPTFNKVMSDMNSEFDTQLAGMGYTRIGKFSTGATLTNPRQTLLWDVADGGDGQEYGWSGSFPKVVPSLSTPNTTGGIAVGAWISRFDPELQIIVFEALRRTYADAGYDLIGRFSNTGLVVNTATDVVLWEPTGVAYAYSGTLPHTIGAGETPIGNPSWVSIQGASLRTDLAGIAGPNLLGFSHNAPLKPGSVGAILKQIVRITDAPFNAPMNSVDDDVPAFNAASAYAASLPNGGVVKVPSGVMTVKSQAIFHSNVDYVFPRSSLQINVDNSVPLQAFYGNNISNFSIAGGRFFGSGTAFTDGNQRHVVLAGCSNFSVVGMYGTKSRNDALMLNSCHDFMLDQIVTPNNYGMGVVIRANCYNGIIGFIEANGNGDTGVATSEGGRGVLIWQSNGIIADTIITKGNTEYGFRLYVEVGDTQPNNSVIVNNLISEGNGTTAAGKIDVYLFGANSKIIINNLLCKTLSNRNGLVIHGKDVLVSNYQFEEIGAGGTSDAIVFFSAENSHVRNISAYGGRFLVTFSPTGISNGCSVQEFKAEVVNVASNLYGTGNKVKHGTAKHIGAGVTDIGFICNNAAAIEAEIDDVLLDGFYRPMEISVDSAKMKITNMRDKNTLDVVRVFGTNLQNLEWYGNSWTANTNPAYLKGAEIKRINGANRFRGVAVNASGASMAHSVGDIIEHTNPVAAGFIGSVCVTAGTGAAAVWKTYGQISA